MHCDRHCVKMILEYAQMLSTSHRLLDGNYCLASDSEKRVKPKKFWLLGGESPAVTTFEYPEVSVVYKWTIRDAICYNVAHPNHPCSVWARETDANYYWLFQLFDGCLREYTARYGKAHSASRLKEFLCRAPKNIRRGGQTPFALAMPEEFKHEDPVEAYRRFYLGAKARFARWRFSETPKWFQHSMEREDVPNLT